MGLKRYIQLGLDLETLVETREKVLDALVAAPTLPIQARDANMTCDNYLAILAEHYMPAEKIGQAEVEASNLSPLLKAIAKVKLSGSCTEAEFKALIENAGDGPLSYLEKLELLRLSNHYAFAGDIFKKLVARVLKENMIEEKGQPYIRKGQFANPYLYDGLAGLVVELVKFSIRENTREYDRLLVEYKESLNIPYAKANGLYDGLAGIGLAQSYLYLYFKKLTDLERGLRTVNSLLDYSYQRGGRFYITEPMQECVLWNYTNGMLGYYYFFDQFLEIIRNVQGEDRDEKVPFKV